MKHANQRDGFRLWRFWGDQKKMTAPARQFNRRVPAHNEKGLTVGRSVLCVLVLLFLASVAWAQKSSTDLTEVSLEDLMNIEVESVYGASKYLQKVTQAPAAVASTIFSIRDTGTRQG